MQTCVHIHTYCVGQRDELLPAVADRLGDAREVRPVLDAVAGVKAALCEDELRFDAAVPVEVCCG